jgi:hypothetical protein
MNTTAVALPDHHPLWPLLDRLRSLYGGLGYVLVNTLVFACLNAAMVAWPVLVAHRPAVALHLFGLVFGMTWVEALPTPLLMPVVMNLAPRSGARRLLWLFGMSLVMCVWCEYLIEGFHYSWDWRSLGVFLDGMVFTSLVVGTCVYHRDARGAADHWMRAQIDRTRLDAELQHAQLQLLRAQIEPHFLFNTLSAVRALARSDRTATVEMLDNLMRYFEAALPRLQGEEVPLAQEMQLVEAYLGIYRVRMGARLNYEIELPDELAQARIPTMLLLTLVENALKHGIDPVVEGGFIRVSASGEQGSLRLSVADSGRGLSVHQGRGTGLANIRQRLLMMYGSGAILSLRPAEPRGMVACVAMPMH